MTPLSKEVPPLSDHQKFEIARLNALKKQLKFSNEQLEDYKARTQYWKNDVRRLEEAIKLLES